MTDTLPAVAPRLVPFSLTVRTPTVEDVTGVAAWIVDPSGDAANDGTEASPWTLAHAASGAGGDIQPGDTVYLRGGTYNLAGTAVGNNVSMFSITVDGTITDPITFASYPGEWAVLSDHRGQNTDGSAADMNVLYVSGDYIIVRDLECKSTSTTREGAFALNSGQVVFVSLGGKVINVISHDNYQSMWLSAASGDAELIGCILYNSGVYQTGGTPQPYGHNLYTQSSTGDTKYLEDVLFMGAYNYNFHAYTVGAQLDGYTVKNCTSLDGHILDDSTGSMTQNPTPGGFDLWGGSSGGKPITNLVIDGHFHDSGLVISDTNEYIDEVRVRNSHFLGTAVSGRGITELRGITNIREFNGNILRRYSTIDDPPVLQLRPQDGSGFVSTITPADPSDFDGNAYYLKDAGERAIKNMADTFRTLAQWQSDTGYDLTSTVDFDAVGPDDYYDVVVNPEESGRGTVRIWKATGTTTMDVDLGDILDTGDNYYLYDGRNPLDGAFDSGTWTGTDVTVTFSDMPGRAQPTGWSTTPTGNEATHPVIVVRKVGPTWVAPPAESITPGGRVVLSGPASRPFLSFLDLSAPLSIVTAIVDDGTEDLLTEAGDGLTTEAGDGITTEI